ncbi:hypothetical protein ILUMI_14368, partial [Ignelater luminosus]
MAKQLPKTKLYNSMLQDVNSDTFNFIIFQLKLQKYKPKGRRFTMQDKVFALSLYRQSPKGHRLLSKIFCLPSRKTIMTLLNKLPFMCGINTHVFDHLKKVAQMKPLDHYCALLFDEVALEPGLQYNRKLDMFEGFEDYGGSERKPSFADHALVFMLKGICRKWKQPIVFTFCKGTTSTLRLTSLLKDVIRQVKLTGLKIMCTICDQGTTNQATINSHLRETEQNCIRQGIDNRHFGFVID